MIPIFIVSMRDSTGRRAAITTRMRTLQIEFEFVDAVVGRHLPADVLHGLGHGPATVAHYGRNLAAAEVGCLLSHLSIYRLMQARALPAAIVLEDDVTFDARLAALAASRCDCGDDLWLLGGQEGLPCRNQVVSLKRPLRIATGVELRKTFASARFLFRTCGYVISRDTAQRLLNYAQQHVRLADDWLDLQRAGCFRHIYLGELVVHPEDLGASSIEVARQAVSKRPSGGAARQLFKRALRGLWYGCRRLVASV